VIKIRYADLPGGLHARAEARGRHTVIYLLPGLTVPQRRAALRRLRSSARMGRGPRLSGAGIVRAMAADRVRTNVKNAAAALRVHPGILAPPLVLSVAAAVAFVLLVPVGFNSPSGSNPGSGFRRSPASQAGPVPGVRGGGLPLTPAPRRSRTSGMADRPRMSVQLMPDPDQGAEPSLPATPSPRPSRTVSAQPNGTASPSPSATASPSPTASSSPREEPSGTSSPSASASASSAGLCLTITLLGACV